MSIAIAIPARYASTRFPGKPLAEIGGQSMLSRVVALAQTAAKDFGGIDVFVTTEDQRIADHAAEIDVECIITPDDCATGSDRVLAALKMRDTKPEYVLNLQGDAPFTPPTVVRSLLEELQKNDADVVTPVHLLSWADLDRLREAKIKTPFSGTTVSVGSDGNALWFSKNIIPAIRKEDRTHPLSPIHQHMGLYGFRVSTLEKFCALPQGHYEQLEGLEQLRLIENDISIKTVAVKIEPGTIQSGIDTPEDLKRAEAMLA